MCVALPGQVVRIGEATPISIPARVSISEVERDVDLVMVPHAEVGDYVIVHSGYAIEIIPRERAVGTLYLLGMTEAHQVPAQPGPMERECGLAEMTTGGHAEVSGGHNRLGRPG